MIGKQNIRVLLVDDEPLFRKLISRYLVAEGCVVRAADDGLDAIGKLRAALPDLIISDLKMPRMSGFEFLDVVRKRLPQIPVIAISGMAADELPASVAADAYYEKNRAGFEQLLQTVSDLTRKPSPRPAPLGVDNQPVLARWDGDGTYVIVCDDCLREFRVTGDPHAGRMETWTHCVQCGKVIQFVTSNKDTVL